MFYQFPGTGSRFRVSTCTPETDFNSGLFVMDENCDQLCSPLVENDNDFDCGSDGFGASVEFFTEQDQLYYILVRGGTSDAVGNFGLSVLEYIRPENDICENPPVLQPRADNATVVTGNLANATVFSSGRFASCSVNGRFSAFYRVVGTGGRLRLSTCTPETDFDSALWVSNENCDILCRAIVENDNDFQCGAEGLGATVEWDSVEGQVYIVAVRGALSESMGVFGLSFQSPGLSTEPTMALPTPTDTPSLVPAPTGSPSVSIPPNSFTCTSSGRCVYEGEESFPFTTPQSFLVAACTDTSFVEPSRDNCDCIVYVGMTIETAQSCVTCSFSRGQSDDWRQLFEFDCSNVLEGDFVGRDSFGKYISNIPEIFRKTHLEEHGIPGWF